MFDNKSGCVVLNNGYQMPCLGLGTWRSDPGAVQRAVEEAIDCGYRHIDCAFVYGNESEVGEALKRKFQDGTIKREDIFVTTKIFPKFFDEKDMEKNLKVSLQRLQLSYVDQVLLHSPMALKNVNRNFDTDLEVIDGKVQCDDIHYTDAWKTLENIYQSTDKVRSIGVSNFNVYQIDKVLKTCKIKPVINQCEMHPYALRGPFVNLSLNIW